MNSKRLTPWSRRSTAPNDSASGPRAVAERGETGMKILKGIAGAPGIAEGPVVFYSKQQGGGEILDLDAAKLKCLADIRGLYEKTLRDVGEEQAKIFSAYEMLLEDEMLYLPIRSAIESGTDPVLAAVEETEKLSQMLATKGGEYMRQRADDIRYIGELLAQAMQGAQESYQLPEGDEPFLLAARELTPVDTMRFDAKRLAGLVTELGGATSHTVILAKSLGIPAVVGVSGIEDAAGEGHRAFLDGYTGEFVLDPDAETATAYGKKREADLQLMREIESVRESETRTADGERIAVCVNIGKPQDLKGADGIRFDGVGLFRSEFLYSSESEKPSIEAQRKAYQKAIDAVWPDPVIIRTLDVGGDKQLGYLNMPQEENPFLGNRGIRLCLNNPEVFEEQLEAILLAAAGKSVKIMLPMITSIHEIEAAKSLLEKVAGRLAAAGTPYCTDAALGIMVETPASAILARQFAHHCDFFSIGTNDLTQYIMSADRGNAAVQNCYNPCHPAVITMIAETIRAGAHAGIEVSVCGDLAADLRFTVLLLGLGLKKFSVPLPQVGRIKYKIANTSLADAQALAEEILWMEDEAQIAERLQASSH